MTRLLSILLMSTCLITQARDVGLAWEQSGDLVEGYKIYWGIAPRSYTNSIDVGASTNAVVPDLKPGVRYYFAATAYVFGLESEYSNEVSYTPKPMPPVLKAPFVTISWLGPFTVEQSTNLMAWEKLLETPFNTASFPIGAEPERYFRVSTADTNITLRIQATPQL